MERWNGPCTYAALRARDTVRLLAGQTRRSLQSVRDLTVIVRMSGWAGSAADLCGQTLDRTVAMADILDADIDVTLRLAEGIDIP